jgi:hypothetical protein
MMKQIILTMLVFLMMTSVSLQAITITLTHDDPCAPMGALNNYDGDDSAIVAMSYLGPSLPYISTAFIGGGHSAARRGIAEFALEPIRDISIDPNELDCSKLQFYFDDVIFPGNSPEPYTTQDFTVELYIDTANGMIDGDDPNEDGPTLVATGPDDWTGEVIASWRFEAGPVTDLVPDGPIIGIFTPDKPFPENFDDDKLSIFGMIGFEVDVTEALRMVLADEKVSHVGFRWISNMDGGYWTSMDPKGYRPTLIVDVPAADLLVFQLQSTDGGETVGDHGGRPYQIFDDTDDEAIYLTVGEWGAGEVWPTRDGIISWPTFNDPNYFLDASAAITIDADGQTRFVYWDAQTEIHVLLDNEDNVPVGLQKVYYETETGNSTLSIGNNGTSAGQLADRQHALLSEFNLQRPARYGLDPNSLVSATLEITIDRVIDMSLNGNNMALLPTAIYVNAFAGDGVLNDFTNAQVDFARIDHVNIDAMIWLTMDGTVDGPPITDFALAYYRLVTNPGEQFMVHLDVTEAVLSLLAEGAEYAGFVLSCPGDGEFTLASVDLVDTVNGVNYLPSLILETNLQ